MHTITPHKQTLQSLNSDRETFADGKKSLEISEA